ncbi:hypothetical protein [Roseivirga misakiensis]|uniref:3-keto-disaccharide hydrolase domain-containing protein n=1 Tax=Roseivirga misakiensis TaxID=1563681 RepID=A0A1E5SYY6_9BACT|nr:hypothetical protein [Roseivirga misakiensis]OEK04257.1 hypothetical protein BFP71_12295 [Roseivirga misakiensis]
MKNRNLLICLLIAFQTLALSAQELLLTAENWDVKGAGHVFEMFEGKQSLYLFNGVAELKDKVSFKTGIIEYEIFVTERRGFPGIHFRIADDQNYEEFYIRPHQSGNPDANQYTPVFNGLSGWQLYYGAGHAASISYQMNAWNRIKIVIAEQEAEVFINDMETPLLYIPELKRTPRAGSIRLSGGGPSPFHFANVKLKAIANPQLKSKSNTATEAPAGIIESWLVSNSFPEESLDSKFSLDKRDFKKLEWTKQASEKRGLLNLARSAVNENGNNTVFAKVTVKSDKEQVKALHYGFSDRVKIFLNGKLLVSGNDGFRTRDYRFLGTMGMYATVYLPLKKGENELWIAVSEDFGGWGLMAAFKDKLGVIVD